MLRLYISDVAGLVLVLAGLLYAMMPGKAAEAERRKKHIVWGALFIVIGIAGFGRRPGYRQPQSDGKS
jgi:hypothetical protein